MYMRGGAVIAGPAFPSFESEPSSAVIEVRGSPPNTTSAAVYFDLVHLEELTVDGGGRAGGSIRMEWISSGKVHLCNIVGFKGVGVYAGPPFAGFVDISHSYLGSNSIPGQVCPHATLSPPFPPSSSMMTSVAALIEMNDSSMSNCYLECSGMGVVVGGSVNSFTDVHFSTSWGHWPRGGLWVKPNMRRCAPLPPPCTWPWPPSPTLGPEPAEPNRRLPTRLPACVVQPYLLPHLT